MIFSRIKTTIKKTFPALKYKNFRLFLSGQSISLIGIWMQSIAMSWLVFRLTKSSFMLGLVGFAGQIPAFILSPLAGVLNDRWSRHRTIIISQALAMIQALSLAYLTLSGNIKIWHIIILNIILGLINAFDLPTRQAFVINMVGKKSDIGNAIALNSAIFNGSRLIGPSIAGIIISLIGEGICFLINGISYIAVLTVLLLMKIPPQNYRNDDPRFFQEFKDGFNYAFGFSPIRTLLIMLSLTSLVGMSFPVLMPVFATDVLHGGSHTLGFLVASSGIGAVIGTIYLALRKTVLGLTKVIIISTSIFGCGLIAFSFSKTLLLSLVLLMFVGFGMIVNLASCNTILQTIVDDDKRGRIMSFYTMTFMGTAPLGSLLTGASSSIIGAPYTVFISGIICLTSVLFFTWKLPSLRLMIRPIYKKIGIIPEVAVGIQSATELRDPPEY